MQDYLKKHATQAAYTTWLGSSDYVIPNVSLIEATGGLTYNPYVAPVTPSGYNMLDILWSDMTTTTTVRPTTDNVTPIGLCVIPTGFLGSNEKARFMALKYAGGSSDGNTVGNATGSVTSSNQYLTWAKSGSQTDIAGLTNYTQLISTDNNSYGYLADYEGSAIGQSCGCGCGSGDPIMLYTESNTWIGLESNNSFTGYGMGDINGQQNTTVINNLGSLSNYPAFASVLNYYTPGTQAGDWYIPAVGELAFICANQSRINTVLTAINTVYFSACMSALDTGNYYWSSTEYDSSHAFRVDFYNGYVYYYNKNYYCYVVPMLQL